MLRRLILVTNECAEWSAPDTLQGVSDGLTALLAATPTTGILVDSGDVVEVTTAVGATAVCAVRARLAGHQARVGAGEIAPSPGDESRLCRLVLDPAGLAEAIGMPVDLVATAARFYSCAVEISFRQHRQHAFCHVTLAVYTHRPHQRGFQLPIDKAERSAPMPADEVRTDLSFFVADLRTAFQHWLWGQGFRSVAFQVFGRPYQSPAFVVAVPYDYKKHRNRAAESLAQVFLRAREGDFGVGSSLFFQNIKVIRRLVAIPTRDGCPAEDHPRYLVLPGRLPSDEPLAAGHDRLFAEQERASAQLLRTFIDIEASAAASLFEMESTFDRIGAHLQVYESVALQAADLWDALAMHLSRRGTELRRAHRSVELLHNTLLQGVADLDQTVTDIREQMEYIEDVAAQLLDRLDRASAERPADGRSVRESITSGGYFDRLRELSRQRAAKAQNVQATYESLLSSMAHAFDERRARESDMAEKSGLPIGVAVGVLGLVTVIQTTVDVAPPVSSGWAWGLRIGCWIIGAATLITLVFIYVRVSRVSRLSSDDFDRRYRHLSAYLQASSTVVLNEFAETADAEGWEEKDRELSERFERVWQDAFDARPAAELRPGDLELLRRRTEDFCLQALLLAERPRDFSRYRLPILTDLYRSRTSKMFVTPAGKPVTLVSDSELRKVLQAER